MMKKHRKISGLSLVEILVATLIFTLVLAAFYGVYINAKNTIALALRKTTALYWTQAEVERLRNHVRAAAAGQTVYVDELGDHAFGPNNGGAGYPTTNDPIDPAASGIYQHRDLVADGASISYPVTFNATVCSPPGYVPYYNVVVGSRNEYNTLTAEGNGVIYQHVDGNTLTTGLGWRQVTIRVRWNE